MSQAQQKPPVSLEPERRAEKPRRRALAKRFSPLLTFPRRLARSFLEELFDSRVYTYREGEGYPEVQIFGDGIISVPIEELRRSAKARENMEALKRMMDASFKEQEEEEERQKNMQQVKDKAPTKSQEN